MEDNNKRLKELMKINPENISPEAKNEFFELLMQARLLIPVEITSSLPNFDEFKVGDTVQLEENIRFKPVYLKNEKGEMGVPLFTDDEEVEKCGNAHILNFEAEDIANLLIQNKNINSVIINPGSEYSIGMSMEDFYNLFLTKEIDLVSEVIDILKKYAVPLDEDSAFFKRTQTLEMVENACDGVYTSIIPFNASIEDVYHPEYKYLNILLIPKGIVGTYLGNIIDDLTTHNDMIFAPIIKFKLVDQKDENTFIWKCIEQDFDMD